MTNSKSRAVLGTIGLLVVLGFAFNRLGQPRVGYLLLGGAATIAAGSAMVSDSLRQNALITIAFVVAAVLALWLAAAAWNLTTPVPIAWQWICTLAIAAGALMWGVQQYIARDQHST
jgi:drug/metabolite transporter (DMT)-like permease